MDEALVLKTDVLARVPWVRIPPSPPASPNIPLLSESNCRNTLGFLKEFGFGNILWLKALISVAFETLELRNICENTDVAVAAYGQSIAQTLQSRLADLKASTQLSDMPVGNPQALSDKDCGRYAISISHTHTLILSCNDPRMMERESGKIDWARLTRVMVVGIEG